MSTAAAGGKNAGIYYLMIGMIGGLMSGLLGIGGGTVMVPLMVLWLGSAQREAHALSLAAIIPISLVAVIVYGQAGEVDIISSIALAIGAIGGARLGAGLLANAKERPLKFAFGCFLIIAALLLVVEA